MIPLVLSFFAGAAIGPCIVGLIVDRGWIYIFIMLISFLAASALVSLFFLPDLLISLMLVSTGRVEPAWLGSMLRSPVPEIDALIGLSGL